MRLYSFNVDCGRMGSLNGLFLATEEEVKAAFGREAYFDEPLGKHSEVTVKLGHDNITLILDESQATAIDALYNAIGDHTISGFNPLEHINSDYDEDEDEPEDEDDE